MREKSEGPLRDSFLSARADFQVFKLEISIREEVWNTSGDLSNE